MRRKAMEDEVEKPDCDKPSDIEDQSVKKTVYKDDDWEPSPEETKKTKYAYHPWFRDYKQREEMMDRRKYIFTFDQFIDGFCDDLVDKVCRDEYIWREMRRIERMEKAASQGEHLGSATKDRDWLTQDEVKRRFEYMRQLRRRNPGQCLECMDTFNRVDGIIDESGFDTKGDKSATSPQRNRGMGEYVGGLDPLQPATDGSDSLINKNTGLTRGTYYGVPCSYIQSSPIHEVLARSRARQEIRESLEISPEVEAAIQRVIEEGQTPAVDVDINHSTTAEEGKRRSTMRQKIRAFFRQLPCYRNRAITPIDT